MVVNSSTKVLNIDLAPVLPYRPDIDGLRAIAVILVVIFHFFPKQLSGGYIGVDIFFVISGYLISTILINDLRRGWKGLLNFYARRILRIFPSLIVVLTAGLCAGWLILLPLEFEDFGKHLLASSGFISNFFYWQEAGYFDKSALYKPLLHLWSLAIEEQFYILWPVLIVAVAKFRLNLLFFTFLCIGFSFLFNIYYIYIERDMVGAFYSPLARFWEMLSGAFLALLSSKHTLVLKSIRYNYYLVSLSSTIGLLAIIAGVYLINLNSQFPGFLALLPVAGAVFIIASGPDNYINKFLSIKPLVFIGLISYPLYLWHWPIISLYSYYFSDDRLSWVIRGALILASIFLAYLTYKFIERPIRNGSCKLCIILYLVIFLLVLGACGAFIFKNKGFQSRFPSLFYSSPSDNEIRSDWSYGKCMLPIYKPENLTENPFANCTDHLGKLNRNVYIWGDSHAAMLVSSLKERFGNKLNFIQRTATSCPPFLESVDFVGKKCSILNHIVLDEITKSVDSTVLLMSSWPWNTTSELSKTIRVLKKNGIKKIVLMGPVPRWNEELPKVLFNYYKSNEFRMPPQYMNFGLTENFFDLDASLVSFSLQNNIGYISLVEIFCNERMECLTWVDDQNQKKSIAFDDAHLTDVGVRHLIMKFPDNFLDFRFDAPK